MLQLLNPENPENLKNPENPENPENLKNPENSENPENPENPEDPPSHRGALRGTGGRFGSRRSRQAVSVEYEELSDRAQVASLKGTRGVILSSVKSSSSTWRRWSIMARNADRSMVASLFLYSADSRDQALQH
ncbi:hypothetical protein BV898_08736 [Hypsibius exemplaris]|uniref:Uncharacterized protein n=1 Tax=Hypsibius exemplaris TaxID=2072580 RepID=A0A1W0WPM4_HYPEX|nr:hypothetical protein BV898_08736 [Hypsibius exemplaris]